MQSLRAIVKIASSGLAAWLLMLAWPGAAEAGEQVGAYTETKLIADGVTMLDYFGASVAISRDTALIGAAGDPLGFPGDTGWAYVFQRDPMDPAVWTQTAKLTASDGESRDRFGFSVAISGDTAVIGALWDDWEDVDGNVGVGSAYIFERDPLDPSVWMQAAKLTASDAKHNDSFGWSVAISGDTAVIAAPSLLGLDAGSAYVFERDPLDLTVWTETANLTASDGEQDELFGYSVAISGDTAVISDPSGDGLVDVSGSAYVFERDPVNPAVWTQAAKLTASDGERHDNFGFSVAISGETAVIGANDSDGLVQESGSAYVFERDPVDPTVWTQTAKLTAADGERDDRFGDSVAISGDTAAIGALGDDDAGSSSGSAYVFERDPVDPAVWTQAAKLTASDAAEGDVFGTSIAVYGDTAVIGAEYDDDLGVASGSAYVYSPLRCDLALALHPLTLGAGEELRVAIDLHHRRPITVTTPLLLWVEDETGRVVAEKTSAPLTLEPGDRRTLRIALTLPPRMPPGTYTVRVGVRRMQQGIAWASREFRVVEP